MLKAISHAEGAKGAELYSLLFTLALEGSQLHATEVAEVYRTENGELFNALFSYNP